MQTDKVKAFLFPFKTTEVTTIRTIHSLKSLQGSPRDLVLVFSSEPLRGPTGKQEGRKSPTSFQINSWRRRRWSFSFSKEKSKFRLETGSSAGLCSVAKKACCKALSKVVRVCGCICSILLRESKASTGVFGNCAAKDGGVLSGNFLMNRLAFSDVTKFSSLSGSFPSF